MGFLGLATMIASGKGKDAGGKRDEREGELRGRAESGRSREGNAKQVSIRGSGEGGLMRRLQRRWRDEGCRKVAGALIRKWYKNALWNYATDGEAECSVYTMTVSRSRHRRRPILRRPHPVSVLTICQP